MTIIIYVEINDINIVISTKIYNKIGCPINTLMKKNKKTCLEAQRQWPKKFNIKPDEYNKQYYVMNKEKRLKKAHIIYLEKKIK